MSRVSLSVGGPCLLAGWVLVPLNVAEPVVETVPVVGPAVTLTVITACWPTPIVLTSQLIVPPAAPTGGPEQPSPQGFLRADRDRLEDDLTRQVVLEADGVPPRRAGVCSTVGATVTSNLGAIAPAVPAADVH